LEKALHTEKLAQGMPKTTDSLQEKLAGNQKIRHSFHVVNLLDQHYLWASCIWGAVASGYMVYGWRQRAMIPFIGSLVMSVACFLSALWMSLICIAVMFAVYWLVKQGY
jgi:hypothetical protein